jgi:PPM family protein phosphatase
MNIEFATATDIGNRSVNQDYCTQLVEPDRALFVVADGLGGHEAGEVAASEFCNQLIKLSGEYVGSIKDNPQIGMLQLIQATTSATRERLIELGHPDARTTCAIAWLNKQQIITGHIGDSRIYLANPQIILWKTHDHSVLQQLIDNGQVREEESFHHPSQTLLLRSVSCHELPQPDVQVFNALQGNEILLLCSDGFWQPIKTEEIMQLAKTTQLQKALDDLVQLCVSRSMPGSDNVTAQAVRIKSLETEI